MRDETPEMDPFSEFLIRHPERGERVFKLIREGQKLLDSGRIKAAERKFRDATRICECAIPALNNLALCASLRGETKRAIRTAHQALEYHPTNVFAHCTLAECYEELGRTEKARFHIERAIVLLEDPGVPLDKLTKVIEALATLQWDEKIDQVYRSYREGVGFEEVLDGISWFYIGVAAANLGHVEEALALWDRARGEEPRFGLPELYTTAALLVQEGKAPSFRFSYHFGKEGEPPDPLHPVEEIKPALVEGIWSEKEDLPHAVVETLGIWEDPWAEEFLRLILTQPELPDDLKVHAASALIDRGVFAEDEEIEMFIKGKRRKVVVNREEVPSPPPAAVKKFESGLALRQAGDIAAAEEAYHEALRIDPDFAEAMVNLANICRSTDRLEEAERLLEKAIALTGSATAILNLAALYLLEQDRVEEGRELINSVFIDELDNNLLPIYYRLLGQLHIFDGDFAAARRVFKELIALQPDDQTVDHLFTLLAGSKTLRDESITLRRKRRERYLRQPVDPQMPLVMALGTLTKDNLIGIAHWYDISYGTRRKAELAQMLADYLQDEETDIWVELSADAWEVVEFLRGVGGSAPLAKLEEKFGSTEDDSIDWKYDFPYSAIGELQISGIVFVGECNGETIVFIPKEMQTKLLRGV